MNQQNQFITDPSLGRLAKWLRILGLDTLYFANPLEEKLFFEKAKSENRMVLTKNERIAAELQRGEYCFISYNLIDDQLRELIDKKIIFYPAELFTRCLECNYILIKISQEEIHGKVPDYVRATEQSFRQCPGCKKIFCTGTH